MNRETRSDARGIDAAAPRQLPLAPDWGPPPPPGGRPGVGGRQTDPRPSARGGGYQHECRPRRTVVRAPGAPAAIEDPRIEELRRIGIGRVWLRVANAIGFEPFMQAWLVLASDDAVLDDRSRVLVPSPTRYTRYQRNILIKQLDEQGKAPREIVGEIKRLLGEQINENHVQRLLHKLRV